MNGYFNNFMNNFQPQLQQNSNIGWIMVRNINEVDGIKVPPSTKAWLMFTDEPIIACKESDSMGISNTKYFEIKEINLNQTQAQNTDNFVTKEDFSKFINELNNKLDNLSKKNNKKEE